MSKANRTNRTIRTTKKTEQIGQAGQTMWLEQTGQPKEMRRIRQTEQ